MTVRDGVQLPDPARSWAVLVGVADYTDLTPQRAIERNVDALRALLTDARFWGMPGDQCQVLLNPATGDAVTESIYHAAQQATEALVVYLAGHGLSSDQGEWSLALPNAHADADHRAVSFDAVRRILGRSKARVKVVVLDSCYSGRILPGLAGDSAAEVLARRLDARGTYVMTACSGSREAMAPPNATFTTFTGALLETLQDGVPGAPAHLPLPTVFAEVERRLRELGDPAVPDPRQAALDGADRIAIVRNQAAGPEIRTPQAEPVAQRPALGQHRRGRIRTAVGVVVATVVVAVLVAVVLLRPDEPTSPGIAGSPGGISASPSAPVPASQMIPADLGELRAGPNCVEARNGDMRDEASIVSTTCNGQPHQSFTAVATGTPTDFKLKFRDQDRCLVALTGTVVGIAACASAEPWRFASMIPAWEGYGSWEIEYTGLDGDSCLTLPAGQNRLTMAKCERSPNTQQWWIKLP